MFKDLKSWLNYHDLEKYHDTFVQHGFDHVDFIGDDIIDESDLISMGISETKLRQNIMIAIEKKGHSKGNTYQQIMPHLVKCIKMMVIVLVIDKEGFQYTIALSGNMLYLIGSKRIGHKVVLILIFCNLLRKMHHDDAFRRFSIYIIACF